MFGIKKKVEIFKKKDKDTWNDIKKALSADGSIKFRAGHYFSETVSHGGCGAKLDPRDFGAKGKADHDVYCIKVKEKDVQRAKELILQSGLVAEVKTAEELMQDASVRAFQRS